MKQNDCIAIYLRLSKEDGEKEESNSIGNQRSLLCQFIKNQKEFDNCKIVEFSEMKIANLIQLVNRQKQDIEKI